ncbi:MAG: histidinol-phosphate transaminase [Nitrospirae bacterium]|nr:histidinol-phosphate transaminase [Nitrospirota bacterium]MBF0542034.1 histidinol-phosphate transaminase [Nitrospirota bacterium]
MTVPKYVDKINPYVPGKPIEELERELGITGSIKLASNENPLGASPKAISAIKNLNYSLNRYPDGNGFYLKEALSALHNVKSDEIILGNGSNELLDVAVRTFMQPGDDAVMADPSFIVYPMSVSSVGCNIVNIPLRDYRHDLKAMADAITVHTKIVFIANPNNPTGTIVYRDEFDDFINRIPDRVLVVMDEAYYEYVTDSDNPDTLKYFRDGLDILILRTFSKAYGLAGLRIGYGIANSDIIKQMNKIRAPFNTNTIAQTAAISALDDVEHIRKSIEINEQGKLYLYKELTDMGIFFVKTQANFMYIDLKVDVREIYIKLMALGIIIRPMGQTVIRVTIGLPEENKLFIDRLKEVL